MKTAVIMNIENGRATLMLTGGAFEMHRVRPGWSVGDIVTVERPSVKHHARLMALAACLFLVILSGIGGGRLYYTESGIISVDINPSFEICINRFGKVIDTRYYNEDGESLVSNAAVKGLPYAEAIETLFDNELFASYLSDNSYIRFSVYSERLEEELLAYLEGLVSEINLRNSDLNISWASADKVSVERAHQHGMTAGKLSAIEELQEYLPELEIQSYAHCSLGEIYNEIEVCQGNRHGQQQDPSSDVASGNYHGGSHNTTPPRNGHQIEHGIYDDRGSSNAGGNDSGWQGGNGGGNDTPSGSGSGNGYEHHWEPDHGNGAGSEHHWGSDNGNGTGNENQWDTDNGNGAGNENQWGSDNGNGGGNENQWDTDNGNGAGNENQWGSDNGNGAGNENQWDTDNGNGGGNENQWGTDNGNSGGNENQWGSDNGNGAGNENQWGDDNGGKGSRSEGQDNSGSGRHNRDGAANNGQHHSR